MGISLLQKYRVGSYVIGQKLRRRRRYPLVLMLEPLFRCNLACAGCGKIAHPEEILNRRLSVADCLSAVDECAAPIVSIPGGEPLIHPDIGRIVDGIVARRKFVYLCTNGLLLERRLKEFQPTRYLAFSIHLDGGRAQHDASVGRTGVFDKAVAAIETSVGLGFRVTVNCTLFRNDTAEEVAAFLDFLMDLGVEGVTIAPGYGYASAPQNDIFRGRRSSEALFQGLFEIGRDHKWRFNHSSLYLDFLTGNQSYQCTPWGSPTRNVLGWQRPCYLLNDEGYAASFQELMDTTDWERYGVGRHSKCHDCMMHCGYEPTAVEDAFRHPLKALRVSRAGPGRWRQATVHARAVG